MTERYKQTERHETGPLPMEFIVTGGFEETIRAAKSRPYFGIYFGGKMPLIDLHARAGLNDGRQTLELHQDRHMNGTIPTNSHFSCVLPKEGEVPIPDENHKLVLTPELGLQLKIYCYEFDELGKTEKKQVGAVQARPKTPACSPQEDSILLVGYEGKDSGPWQNLFAKVIVISPEELLARCQQFSQELSARRHKSGFRNDEAVRAGLSAELFPELMISLKLGVLTYSPQRKLLEKLFFCAYEPAVVGQAKDLSQMKGIYPDYFGSSLIDYWLETPDTNPLTDTAFKHYVREVKAYR